MFVLKVINGVITSKQVVKDDFSHEDYVQVSEEQYSQAELFGGYDNGVLTPADPVTDNLRSITAPAFRDRFSLAHKVAIKASTNPLVKVMEDELMSKISTNDFVNLDSNDLVTGFDELVSEGIMTDSDVVLMRRNGEPHELFY